MTKQLLILILLLAAAAFVVTAYRTWRDPNNWHLDEQTKDPDFHAWPQLGLLILGAVCAALFGYLIAGI